MAKIGYFNAIIGDDGTPRQATITVCIHGTTTPAALYADAAGTVVKANPFSTDNLGRFQFFVSQANYDVKVSGSGITTYTIENAVMWNYRDVHVGCTGNTDLSAIAGACDGQFYNNVGATGNIEIDLPEAAVGMSFTARVSAAYAIKLDPNGTDQIDILTDAAGDYLVSDAVIGTFIQLKCEVAGHWVMWGMNGSWTEE